MAANNFSVELQAHIWDLRLSGLTIEQTALELGVAMSTVQRHGPKGVQHGRRGSAGHWANGAVHDKSHLEPAARIAKPHLRNAHRKVW